MDRLFVFSTDILKIAKCTKKMKSFKEQPQSIEFEECNDQIKKWTLHLDQKSHQLKPFCNPIRIDFCGTENMPDPLPLTT